MASRGRLNSSTVLPQPLRHYHNIFILGHDIIEISLAHLLLDFASYRLPHVHRYSSAAGSAASSNFLALTAVAAAAAFLFKPASNLHRLVPVLRFAMPGSRL
ncbi:hypothetical protein HAX54_031740 [Datura stramonium]|uniref:Uncharacterized protein n=1 Tax=Datura stramonium TaxID=4076 RepID=A0ABS8SC43_DATST|nr:hypothetical protein [Datura stramonium]